MSNIKYLSFQGHHFAYRTQGNGPDLILLHGWLSSSRMWQGVMDHLSDRFRLWAIDLMGFGDSWTEHKDLELGVPTQARLVAEFCQETAIHPHAIIGHSMGSAITLKLALDYPHLLDKMALISPVVTGRFHFNIQEILGTSVGKKMLSTGTHFWPLIKNVAGASASIPPLLSLRPRTNKWHDRSLEDFRKASWPAACHGLQSLFNIGLDRRLHEIAKPTFVATGSRDFTVPPSDARLAARSIRGAQLLEIPDCHHHLPDEKPEHFHQAISQFLSADSYAAVDVV